MAADITFAIKSLEELNSEARHILKKIECLLYEYHYHNLECRKNGIIEYVRPSGCPPSEVYDLKTSEGIKALRALCLKMLETILPCHVCDPYIIGKNKKKETVEVNCLEPYVSLLWLTHLLRCETEKASIKKN